METESTKKKSKEEAYEVIKDLILSMKISPGESITENALSEQLGIGRTPVREALTKLEMEGLVVSQNGRKKIYLLTIQDMIEIFDIKITLEGAIARWAAERGSAQGRKLLETVINEMKVIANNRPVDAKERDKYLNAWLSKDRELHKLIFSMAGNQRAVQHIQNLNAQWHRLRIAAYALEGRIVKSATEHESFVLPIIYNNPEEAEKAMHNHLENLKIELIDTMKLFHYPEQ
jgi:GntR family transcriptional regulator, rspAB operon transcriptional repressor